MKKAREAIKRKYNSLKLSKLDAEHVANTTFKPIVEPLEKLIDITETQSKVSRKKSIVKKEENSDDGFDDYELKQEEREVVDEEEEKKPVYVDESLKVDTEKHTNTLNRGNKNDLVIDKYITMIRRGETKALDLIYGIRTKSDDFYIGNTPFSYDNEFIILENKQYKKSPGVIELLFKKEPESTNINKSDLSDYSKIVKQASAHKKYYKEEEPIRDSNSKKFVDCIAKMSVIKDNKRTSEEGSSLPPPFKIARRYTNTDYIYWDDPNELVN
ncbi:hypothetical protein TSAR_016936 [Trichomalopsis sarcophagae]|uniref:DUF8207 domain-containing protein n=1 Tax=Trichomalopsis sarcophagae TaxID=543379 RepID=A0A232EDY6_9HYME|nr:hypothetical protein TSAR_016936 [Trichomalopsis sarcophagae]